MKNEIFLLVYQVQYFVKVETTDGWKTIMALTPDWPSGVEETGHPDLSISTPLFGLLAYLLIEGILTIQSLFPPYDKCALTP
jgi:hypothetical protein